MITPLPVPQSHHISHQPPGWWEPCVRILPRQVLQCHWVCCANNHMRKLIWITQSRCFHVINIMIWLYLLAFLVKRLIIPVMMKEFTDKEHASGLRQSLVTLRTKRVMKTLGNFVPTRYVVHYTTDIKREDLFFYKIKNNILKLTTNSLPKPSAILDPWPSIGTGLPDGVGFSYMSS